MKSTANSILLLSLACILGFCFAQVADQIRVENYPLSLSSPVNCEEIVETHTFEGTCCALNVTAGDGCVLNVVNGQCVIKGQYFTLDFTSTVSDEPCPPGEYTSADLGIEGPPTLAPLNDSGSVPKSSGLLSSLLAFFAITASLAL